MYLYILLLKTWKLQKNSLKNKFDFILLKLSLQSFACIFWHVAMVYKMHLNFNAYFFQGKEGIYL